jgi:hypothetical protein
MMHAAYRNLVRHDPRGRSPEAAVGADKARGAHNGSPGPHGPKCVASRATFGDFRIDVGAGWDIAVVRAEGWRSRTSSASWVARSMTCNGGRRWHGAEPKADLRIRVIASHPHVQIGQRRYRLVLQLSRLAASRLQLARGQTVLRSCARWSLPFITLMSSLGCRR